MELENGDDDAAQMAEKGNVGHDELQNDQQSPRIDLCVRERKKRMDGGRIVDLKCLPWRGRSRCQTTTERQFLWRESERE